MANTEKNNSNPSGENPEGNAKEKQLTEVEKQKKIFENNPLVSVLYKTLDNRYFTNKAGAILYANGIVDKSIVEILKFSLKKGE